MKKTNLLPLMALISIQTNAFAYEQASIPNFTLQCSANKLPCNSLTEDENRENMLGVLITTAPSCNSSTLVTTGKLTAAFGMSRLSPTKKKNIQVNIGTFIDRKGTQVSDLENELYTVCAFYGVQQESTLTITYFKQVITSFKNIEEIKFESGNWEAL